MPDPAVRTERDHDEFIDTKLPFPMPKISVVVPVYKPQEEHLRAAVESILSQSFGDFELLMLDDCPQDRTAETIIRSYGDSRIRYVRNSENLGISASRNKLLEMAQGEYIAVMDHDDVSLPERFARQAAYLDEHPSVGVTGCRVREIPSGKIAAWPVEDQAIRLALIRGCAIPHSAAMIRRSVLVENSIRYEERFFPAEDYALWCRLLSCTQFHNLEEILFEYRLHPGNTSKLQVGKMNRASYAIRAFLMAENPALHLEFMQRASHVTRVRLFGVLPFLKIVRQYNRLTVNLFEMLPLFSCKSVSKVK